MAAALGSNALMFSVCTFSIIWKMYRVYHSVMGRIELWLEGLFGPVKTIAVLVYKPRFGESRYTHGKSWGSYER